MAKFPALTASVDRYLRESGWPGAVAMPETNAVAPDE